MASNALFGLVYGQVDWITRDRREIGLFVKTSDRASTRCVLSGPLVEQHLKNHLVQKGSLMTASGEMYARCVMRHDQSGYLSEVVCEVNDLRPEPARDGRIRGSVTALLKGVVMHWDPSNLMLKTFFNFDTPGRPERVTCSLYMNTWVASLPDAEGRERFKQSIRVGRTFTSNVMVETSSYRSKEGVQVPSLLLLPSFFLLQG